MLPYYILIFAPMLIPLVRSKGIVRLDGKTVDSRNQEIAVFFSVLALMLMFRGTDCGVDTVAYKFWFDYFKNQSWGEVFLSTDIELGYAVLNKIVSLFSSDAQWMIVITSVLSVLPVYLFYRKNAELPVLTYLLFATVAPFSMYFSGIRQALAMGLVFPAWHFARKKKLFKFLLCVVLAMLFHKSAFIIVVLYPLYSVRITIKWLTVVLPAMGVVYLFNKQIFTFMTQFLWEDYGSISDTGASTVLILLIIFAAYSFLVPDETKMNDEIVACRNVLLFSIMMQCFAPLHALAMRMNYYFLLFIPVLIPKIANLGSARNRRITTASIAVMTLFFAAYFFYRAYASSDVLQLFPYVPFWA